MRQLVGHSEGNLGVYASVQKAGSLMVNDAIEVI